MISSHDDVSICFKHLQVTHGSDFLLASRSEPILV